MNKVNYEIGDNISSTNNCISPATARTALFLEKVENLNENIEIIFPELDRFIINFLKSPLTPEGDRLLNYLVERSIRFDKIISG